MNPLRRAQFNLLPVVTVFISIFAYAKSVELDRDPFHLKRTMPSESIYAGARINTDEARTVTDITGTVYQGDIVVPEGYRLVTNFLHANGSPDFYTALIPVDSVEQEYLALQPFWVTLHRGFKVRLAHQMLRFKFTRPIFLVAKTPHLKEFEMGIYNTSRNSLLPKPIELNELLVSPEPSAPYGINAASIADGIFNNRVIAIRMMSISGRSRGIGDRELGEIQSIPLLSTRETGLKSLQQVLADANDYGMSTMYNIFASRCDIYCMRVLSLSRPGISEREQTQFTIYLAPFLDFINKAQYLTRIFPALTPMSLITQRWTNLNPKLEELRHSLEFQRLEKETADFCWVELVGSKANGPAEPSN